MADNIMIGENLSPPWSGKDWAVLLVVLALIFAALTPFAFVWKGIFHDDLAYIYYPNYVFMARNLQRGIIPLWDPHTLAGGCPFYASYGVGSLYLPNWLLLARANLSTLRTSYRDTVIIPVVFHFLLSGLFAYLLGRLGMKLERWGSAALALTWSLGSALHGNIPNPADLFGICWIPGLLLFQALHARTGKTIYLAGGGLVFGLLAPSYAIYTIQIIFLAGVFALLVGAQSIPARDFRKVFRPVWGVAAMILIGILLSGGFWWALYHSTRDMAPYYPFDLSMMTAGQHSIPFRYLAVFLIPTLFNSLDFAHTWNIITRDSLWLSQVWSLTRGLPLIFLAYLAVTGLWARREERWRVWRGWMLTGLILFILGVLILLGRHTPVYGLLYRFLPFFRVPYADRWYTISSVGISLLVGVGVSALKRSSAENHLLSARRFFVFLILALLGVLIAASWPLTIGGHHYRTGWEHLIELGYISWFLQGPMMYLFINLAIIGVVSWRRFRRWALPVLLGLLVVNLVWLMYYCMFDPWKVRWDEEVPTLTKYRGPWEDPYLAFGRDHPVPPVPPWGSSRVVYYRTTLSQNALLRGGFAVLGWSVKPIVPRLHEVLSTLCRGFPHELLVENFDTRFFENMSAGSVWIDHPGRGGKVRDAIPWVKWRGYLGMRYTRAVPRLFTLDRIRVSSPDEQREALLNGDLTELVWVDQDEDLFLRRHDLPADRDYFRNLQNTNPILDFDVTHPNQLVATIDVKVPAMLVCTDIYHPGWRVQVDGRPAHLYRVNFLQRGVWLEAGWHRVEMKFRPKAMTIWMISAPLGIALLLGLSLLAMKGKRDKG